jgi:hypothetical protein
MMHTNLTKKTLPVFPKQLLQIYCNPRQGIDLAAESDRSALMQVLDYIEGFIMSEKWASIDEHPRYMERVDPRSRRHCHCGCGRRATHNGMANGVCLATGCELYIRRWLRDGRMAARVLGRKQT